MEHGKRGGMDLKPSKPIKEVKNKSPRRSRRVLGMEPAKFNKIFNITTMALGIIFLPTHVTAAPMVPTPPPTIPLPLYSNSGYKKPLTSMEKGQKMEKLRAYHSICCTILRTQLHNTK